MDKGQGTRDKGQGTKDKGRKDIKILRYQDSNPLRR